MEAIFISGPSGVGKTTVARELQAMLSESWLFWEVDRCQPPLPARPGLATLENEHAMTRANVGAVRSYVDAGFRVLAEIDVTDTVGRAAVTDLLGVRARILVLTCPPALAIERATTHEAGADLEFVRRHASAREWASSPADRVEATDGRSPAEVARSLVAWIEAPPINP